MNWSYNGCLSILRQALTDTLLMVHRSNDVYITTNLTFSDGHTVRHWMNVTKSSLRWQLEQPSQRRGDKKTTTKEEFR